MPPEEIKLALLTITFIATFLLPVANAILLRKFRIIASLEMKTNKERILPYLSAVLFYAAELYAVVKADLPSLIKAMMWGATLLVTAVMLINLIWKISAHMAGIGGLIGMVIAISFHYQINLHEILIILFVAAGLVGFSRLKLCAHNPAQVYAGFLLGITVQLLLFL